LKGGCLPELVLDTQTPERLPAIDEQRLTGGETSLGRSQKGNRIGNHVGAGRLGTGSGYSQVDYEMALARDQLAEELKLIRPFRPALAA